MTMSLVFIPLPSMYGQLTFTSVFTSRSVQVFLWTFADGSVTKRRGDLCSCQLAWGKLGFLVLFHLT